MAEISEQTLRFHAASGGGIGILGNLIGKLATVALHVLLARVLGPEEYGLYALGYSVFSVARPISGLGLYQGVIRYGALYYSEGNYGKLKATLLIALAGSLISSIMVTAILVAVPDEYYGQFFRQSQVSFVIKIFVISLPFYTSLRVLTSFAQALRRIDCQQFIRNIIRPLLNICLVWIVFLLGFGLRGAVYSYFATGTLSVMIASITILRLLPPSDWFISARAVSKSLLTYSLPTLLISASYMLLIYCDRLILGFFAPASTVGIYNGASMIALQLEVLLGAVTSSFTPIVAHLYNQGHIQQMNSLFKTVTRWVLSLAMPATIVLVFYRGLIMTVYGSDFSGIGAAVLSILAVAQLINASTGPLGMVMLMTGRQNLLSINSSILVLVNVGLNLLLIPIYGATGAAIATSLSITLVMILSLIQMAIIFGMFPYDKRTVKPICAGLGAIIGNIIFLWVVSPSSWYVEAGGAVITVLTYLLLLYLSGIEDEDKEMLGQMRRRFSSSL